MINAHLSDRDTLIFDEADTILIICCTAFKLIYEKQGRVILKIYFFEVELKSTLALRCWIKKMDCLDPTKGKLFHDMYKGGPG